MPRRAWSTTSWQTSRSSCTSEARPPGPSAGRGALARLAALVRLAHPFPSLLNAVATGAIATIAGAPPPTALRLAASMLALQASIGAMNDVVDGTDDAGRKPGKPIPRGLVDRRTATFLAGAALAVGLGLSAPSGPATLAVAALGVGLGYAYDLALSGTALSWLPLAAALPLVPIHAWLGATGSLPPGTEALVPAGILAGAGLALGNGLADLERDVASARRSAVVRLGRDRSWWLHAAAFGAATILAFLAAPTGGGASPVPGVGWRDLLLAIGAAMIVVGVVLARATRPIVRERGWELEAVGVAGLALGWLSGLAGSGPAA